MNFVIPMAGHGQRFADAGYKVPKMLIEAHGKTLLEWSIDSLPLALCTRLVCILLAEHERQHNLSRHITARYGNRVEIKFHFLEQVTRGQAETVLLSRPLVDENKDLLVFNIDTYFHSDTLAEKLQRNDIDGVLGAFESTEPRFSFAVVDKLTGLVTRTAEKEVISTHALTGLYHFRRPVDFFEAATHYITNDIRVNNEFYIAPMYNYLIAQGKKYVVDEAAEHHILGTPAELKNFLELKPVKHAEK
jgi:dTDP-glucose pyrophosphorylase